MPQLFLFSLCTRAAQRCGFFILGSSLLSRRLWLFDLCPSAQHCCFFNSFLARCSSVRLLCRGGRRRRLLHFTAQSKWSLSVAALRVCEPNAVVISRLSGSRSARSRFVHSLGAFAPLHLAGSARRRLSFSSFSCLVVNSLTPPPPTKSSLAEEPRRLPLNLGLMIGGRRFTFANAGATTHPCDDHPAGDGHREGARMGERGPARQHVSPWLTTAQFAQPHGRRQRGQERARKSFQRRPSPRLLLLLLGPLADGLDSVDQRIICSRPL